MKRQIYTLFILLFAVTVMANPVDPKNDKEATALESFIALMEKAKKYNLEVLEAMSDKDMSYKPTDEVRSFAAQIYHMAYSVKWYNEKFKGQAIKWEPGDEDKLNKEELKEMMTGSFDATIAILKTKEADDSQLTEGLIGLLDHNSHHRGQAIVYLRMKGIKPPVYR